MQKITRSLFLTVLILSSFSASAQKQNWRWQNPLPQGNTLRGSAAINSFTIAMVGDAGTIIKTKDGGKNWERLPTNTRQNLYAVHFLDSVNGMAVGEDGVILKTTDCGKNWETLTSGRKDTLRGLVMLTKKKIICVGDTGTILITNDGGKNWTYSPHPGLRSNLNSILFPAPDFGVIVGDSFPSFGGPPIIFSEDSGTTFSPWGGGNTALTNINLNAVWMPEKDPNKAILVGDQGTIVSTTTKGQTFSTPISPVTVNISGVWFFDDQNGFATGPNGTILRTTDCGDTWSLIITPPINRDIITVIFPDSSNGYFGGSGGLLFGTNDGANSFTTFQSGFRPNLTDITFLDDSFGIAIGSQGAFLRTTNGGNDWERPPLPLPLFPWEAVTSTQGKAWAAGGTFGDSARIIFSCDSGSTWDPKPFPSPVKLFGIHFRDSLNGTAVGLSGLIYCTRNGGKNWFLKLSNTFNWLLDIAQPSDSFIYVCGGFGTVLRSTTAGSLWVPQGIPTQEWLTSITFLDDSFGMTCGNHGTVFCTQDAGNTWVDISIPRAIDTDFTGVSLFQRDFGANKNGEGDIGATVVGFGGEIYFSPDFGKTWIEQNSGTNLPLWNCFFLDSLTGWAVGDNGTIIHTSGHFDPNVSIDKELERPRLAYMGAAYPNPAYTSTTIPFQLKSSAHINLTLYDWAGRFIQTIADKKLPAGSYEESLDVANLSEGYYLYRLQVGEETFVKRLIVLD